MPGCGVLLWLSVLQSIPVSIAYPMLSLNFVCGYPRGLGHLA